MKDQQDLGATSWSSAFSLCIIIFNFNDEIRVRCNSELASSDHLGGQKK